MSPFNGDCCCECDHAYHFVASSSRFIYKTTIKDSDYAIYFLFLVIGSYMAWLIRIKSKQVLNFHVLHCVKVESLYSPVYFFF